MFFFYKLDEAHKVDETLVLPDFINSRLLITRAALLAHNTVNMAHSACYANRNRNFLHDIFVFNSV
jgi:hypothetical protein